LLVILFYFTRILESCAWIRLKSIQAIISVVNRNIMPFHSIPFTYLTWDSRVLPRDTVISRRFY